MLTDWPWRPRWPERTRVQQLERTMLKQASPDLLLVNMPWATGHRPSIPLAILRSLAVEEGASVRTFYGNLDMAAIVGFETAARFADERTLFGYSEHIFAT